MAQNEQNTEPTTEELAQALKDLRERKEREAKAKQEKTAEEAKRAYRRRVLNNIAASIREAIDHDMITLNEVDALTHEAKCLVLGYAQWEQDQKAAAEAEANSPANWDADDRKKFID